MKEIGPKASVRQIYDFSRKVFSHKVDSLTGVKEILDLELTYLKIGIKASQDTTRYNTFKFFLLHLALFSLLEIAFEADISEGWYVQSITILNKNKNPFFF